MCVFCNPYCDICRPKFAQCGSCGGNVAFSEGTCPRCGEPISQEDIDRGMDAWKQRKALRDAEQRERAARAMGKTADKTR